MDIGFRGATVDDSDVIGSMVMRLTEEISGRTASRHFNIDLESTTNICRDLLQAGQYAAILACIEERPIAVATVTETYALYAGGKIGVIQEFYVDPEFRSRGVGKRLLEEVRSFGRERGWSCIELTTPPLPEFERTLEFYETQGLAPVGGRKMRQYLEPISEQPGTGRVI